MVDTPTDIIEAWAALARLHDARGSRGANKPQPVSRPGFLEDSEEGHGEQPLPGLPRGFLAYQIRPRERRLNGGGRDGMVAEQDSTEGSPFPSTPLPGA